MISPRLVPVRMSESKLLCFSTFSFIYDLIVVFL